MPSSREAAEKAMQALIESATGLGVYPDVQTGTFLDYVKTAFFDEGRDPFSTTYQDTASRITCTYIVYSNLYATVLAKTKAIYNACDGQTLSVAAFDAMEMVVTASGTAPVDNQNMPRRHAQRITITLTTKAE